MKHETQPGNSGMMNGTSIKATVVSALLAATCQLQAAEVEPPVAHVYANNVAEEVHVLTESEMDAYAGQGLSSKVKAVMKLLQLNMRIYGYVGWQYGRLEALRKYGIDIGKYPGWHKAMGSSFWKRF